MEFCNFILHPKPTRNQSSHPCALYVHPASTTPPTKSSHVIYYAPNWKGVKVEVKLCESETRRRPRRHGWHDTFGKNSRHISKNSHIVSFILWNNFHQHLHHHYSVLSWILLDQEASKKKLYIHSFRLTVAEERTPKSEFLILNQLCILSLLLVQYNHTHTPASNFFTRVVERMSAWLHKKLSQLSPTSYEWREKV